MGKAAKDNAILYPKNVVIDVKNYMGKNKNMKEYDGKKYTPEMISSLIIRKVVQDSEEYLGQKYLTRKEILEVAGELNKK